MPIANLYFLCIAYEKTHSQHGKKTFTIWLDWGFDWLMDWLISLLDWSGSMIDCVFEWLIDRLIMTFYCSIVCCHCLLYWQFIDDLIFFLLSCLLNYWLMVCFSICWFACFVFLLAPLFLFVFQSIDQSRQEVNLSKNLTPPSARQRPPSQACFQSNVEAMPTQPQNEEGLALILPSFDGWVSECCRSVSEACDLVDWKASLNCSSSGRFAIC